MIRVIQLGATEEKDCKVHVEDRFSWTHEAVLSLIQAYKSNQQNFTNHKVRKMDVWRDIASTMREQGYDVTAVICNKKWYNLKAQYFASLKRRKLHYRRRWEYAKYFSEIYCVDSAEEDPSSWAGVSSSKKSRTQYPDWLQKHQILSQQETEKSLKQMREMHRELLVVKKERNKLLHSLYEVLTTMNSK